MKSQLQTGDLVVLESGEGRWAAVGQINGVPGDRIEIAMRPHRLKGEVLDAKGKPVRGSWWIVSHDEISTTTGQRRNIRGGLFEDRSDALRTFKEWKANPENRLTGHEQKQTTATPVHCDPLTRTDFDDVLTTQLAMRRRLYPQTCAALAEFAAATPPQRSVVRHRLITAFQLDCAKLKGKPGGPPVPPDPQTILSLARAILAFKAHRRDPKLLAVDCELAFGWIASNFCFLKASERATAINANLGTGFSPELIEQRRKRLGLVAKRKTGNPPPLV